MDVQPPDLDRAEPVAARDVSDVESVALGLLHATPLSFMLQGYGRAAKMFAINDAVARQLREAAFAEARSVVTFGHAAAQIWVRDMPLTPISAVIKSRQTQALLIRHLEASAHAGRARLSEISQARDAILAADQRT